MKVYNFLPVFLECMQAWDQCPSLGKFDAAYYSVVAPLLRPMLEDWDMESCRDFHDELKSLDWQKYRHETLTLDPVKEEQRLRTHILGVEKLLGVQLVGEAVLFSAFAMMDGYARFDKGTHRVFLGVDESHARGNYLDILLAHELTHVARESQASVWEGFSLDPKMSHDSFAEHLPVVEHLFNEGFSCVVSEILVPQKEIWNYAYQTEDSLAQVLRLSASIDEVIHRELKISNGNYGNYYDTAQYRRQVPAYCHYVWAWQWVKKLVATRGNGQARNLLGRSSKEFIPDALAFQLTGKLS